MSVRFTHVHVTVDCEVRPNVDYVYLAATAQRPMPVRVLAS